MPNRILKESICTSENVEQLSAFEETFFYRLIVNCDDYGRMDARAKILKARLYPLKHINERQIENALKAVQDAGLVIIYAVDNKPYLQIKTWEKHQQVRAKKSKYPPMDDSICRQMISVDNKCPRNPIQSESNPNPNTNTKTNMIANANMSVLFERFWTAYPRKEAKQAAKKAFDKINPGEELLNTMLAAIARWKVTTQWTEKGGQFIPHPATWLNQRRWEDEIPAVQQSKHVSSNPAQSYSQRSYASDKTESERANEFYSGLAERLKGGKAV